MSPRNCASTSTLRDSNPDSGVPSFTHWLRMSCARRSTDSSCDGRLRRVVDVSFGRDAVHEQAVLVPPLGLARVHHVLEVGERLALGHHAPVPLREHLVRELLHRRGPERERRVAQQLHALGVMFLDRFDPAGHVGERVTVRGQAELHAVELRDEVERREIRLQRVGLAHARDVRRDRRQHVVTGEQRAGLGIPQRTSGRRCGRACARRTSRGPRGASARRDATGRSAPAA